MDSNKRPETMERITTPALAEAFIEEQLEKLDFPMKAMMQISIAIAPNTQTPLKTKYPGSANTNANHNPTTPMAHILSTTSTAVSMTMSQSVKSSAG